MTNLYYKISAKRRLLAEPPEKDFYEIAENIQTYTNCSFELSFPGEDFVDFIPNTLYVPLVSQHFVRC